MILHIIAALSSYAGPAVEPVQPATQIAHLNHMYAVVDPSTAKAISDSKFLRSFANLEVRTTTGTRATWTGRYLRGKTTYVEFFAPPDFNIKGQPAPIGAWGIAISGDRKGDLQRLRRRIEDAGLRAVDGLETRRFGKREVPWFRALTAITRHGDSGDLAAAVTLWAMEYEPSYFALPEADKEPAEGPDDVISRERYQPDSYADRMMKDVTHVELGVTPRDFRRIEPMLVAAGFRLKRSGHHVAADGVETDFDFWLTTPRYAGLRRLEFSLNAPATRHVEALGRSTLKVGPGATASWFFQPH